MSFRFRKLYADLITAQGDVLVVYLTWLDAWGYSRAWCGTELYSASGERQVSHAQGPVAWDASTLGRGTMSIQCSLGSGRLDFALSDALPGWTPEETSAGPPLSWKVLTPRASARATITQPTGRLVLEGIGYADWVELRRPLRAMGIETVSWGRSHLPNGAIVVSQFRLRSGVVRGNAAFWNGAAAPSVTKGVELQWNADTLTLGLKDAGLVSWSPARVLHDGPALDTARFPNLGQRAIARTLSGPINERRLLGGAAPAASPYRTLYERVSFRKR